MLRIFISPAGGTMDFAALLILNMLQTGPPKGQRAGYFLRFLM